MKEKRAFVRVPLGLDLTYQTDQGIIKPRLAMGQDLSFGGMRFTHAERLDLGHKVTITMNFPREGLVVLRGVVVWTREGVNGRGGYQSGLKWGEFNPLAQSKLNAFLLDRTSPRRAVPIPAPATESPIEPAVIWSRAIVLALFGFTALAFAAFFWLQHFQLLTEVESLRTANRSLEQQLLSLLRF